MDYEASFRKDRNGWRGDTSIPLEGRPGYFLDIKTYKHSRKGVVTYASTSRRDGGFVTTRVFRDYHATVIHDQTARCTEKTVKAQHAQALSHVPLLLDLEAKWEAEKSAEERS